MATEGEDNFGSDIELDDELEGVLTAVESQGHVSLQDVVTDIEDMIPRVSPFLEFRKKGWLSVSDLVGLLWCEVQYDYRLRTKPFLPPDQRPDVITSRQGALIPVNTAKVEDKEKILRRGEKIHKRLEREIHPEAIAIRAVSREDVWGLRFLNMFSALEALLTIGKCRELPVVGFVQGVLVMGVIDEITRVPLNETSAAQRNTRSGTEHTTQTSLTKFFSPTKPRSTQKRTHRLFVSDSKTRASGTVPKESDTLAGRFQVMLYKELLDALLLSVHESKNLPSVSSDAILPSETPFRWDKLFADLQLDPEARFSDEFISQSRPVVAGNGLRFDVERAQSISDMTAAWATYVSALGLGTPTVAVGKADKGEGRTDDRLELVYRRAGAKHKSGKKEAAKAGTSGGSRKSKRKASVVDRARSALSVGEENEAFQRAIEESLKERSATISAHSPGEQVEAVEVVKGIDSNEDATDELTWAVEMSLGSTSHHDPIAEPGVAVLRASQTSPTAASETAAPLLLAPPLSDLAETADTETTTPKTASGGSGSIIGRSVFSHSPRRLTAHLSSVLQWWMGDRDAVGVSLHETSRCAWCEFEEACEWRSQKAQEASSRAIKMKQRT